MTKIDIIQNVHEKLGFSKKDSSDIVESVFDIIKDSLAKGDRVKISGFGNFLVKEKERAADVILKPDRKYPLRPGECSHSNPHRYCVKP